MTLINSNLITTKEAAQKLKKSTRQIRRLIINGKLPAIRVGRDWLITL